MTGKEAASWNRLYRLLDRAAANAAEADRLLSDWRREKEPRRPRREAAWSGDPGVKGYT